MCCLDNNNNNKKKKKPIPGLATDESPSIIHLAEDLNVSTILTTYSRYSR